MHCIEYNEKEVIVCVLSLDSARTVVDALEFYRGLEKMDSRCLKRVDDMLKELGLSIQKIEGEMRIEKES